ncbi:MAG TPA: P-loop NTPase [Candidatus Hydrogenedentes bacterium]|nr:P-loop NTPase [Candidatus Hydrogenedentota bacterium]HPG68709.1 P-loop NTPase [Candidatus Hydrogenedentota bacterium]
MPEWVEQTDATLVEEPPLPVHKTPIMAVGGGKGGVGKTCFAVNAAVEIAQKGWRVVLVDADLGCSNVEAVLGVRAPVRLDDFFFQEGGKKLDPLLTSTPYDNLRFIPGASGLLDVANPKYQRKMAFIRELRQLAADLVIIDLDAGSHLNTLDLFLTAEDLGVLVVTPERTSIDNAFKFLRAALFRKIERFYRCPEVSLLLQRNETVDSFLEQIARADVFEEEERHRVCRELMGLVRSVRPRIVVNKVSNAYEAQIAANILARYARQLLRIEPERLGFMFFDQCVPETVNSGTPFVVSRPTSRIATCITDMANRLGYV